jgi:hypothetical protein
MTTKTLDRHTKAELIALVQSLQADNHALGGKAAQLTADLTRVRQLGTDVAAKLCDEVQDLREQLSALESRRRHEVQSFRAKLHTRGASRTPSLADAAKAYCAANGVKSCTKEQAVAFAQSARS